MQNQSKHIVEENRIREIDSFFACNFCKLLKTIGCKSRKNMYFLSILFYFFRFRELFIP